MKTELKLSYKPFETDDNLTIKQLDYNNYISAPGMISVLENMVITPLDESLKLNDKDELTFGDLKLGKSTITRSPSTSWKPVYEKLVTFVEIRADDVRAKQIEGLKYFEGVGYCIKIDDVLNEIDARIAEFTSKPEPYIQINWPRVKKGESPVRTILIPNRDYKKITEENVKISLQARKFVKSLNEEVVSLFKEANRSWIQRETGYIDETQIPAREESPINRLREVGENSYLFLQLTREEKPQYKKIVSSTQEELLLSQKNKKSENLRIKVEDQRIFVNLKSLQDRIKNIYKEDIDAGKRFTLVP